jgi:hypothetical protein
MTCLCNFLTNASLTAYRLSASFRNTHNTFNSGSPSYKSLLGIMLPPGKNTVLRQKLV